MAGFFAHEKFKEQVAHETQKALQSFAAAKDTSLPNFDSAESVARLLNVPPQFELGQLAMPCFPFAKMLKMGPPQVAQELADRVNAAKPSLIANVSVAGGFLNFQANFNELAAEVLPPLLKGELFSAPLFGEPGPEKIVIEYSQPNTHKALHVGHLRCLVLGDAVSRILEGAGHKVIKVTYPGDMGAHIAKTLWYLKNHHSEKAPEKHRGDWLGDLYASAHAFMESESTNPQRASEIKAIIGEILAELQQGSGPYYDLWLETREWSFQEMRDTYDWMDVTFDQWFTESECDAPSRELVLQKEKEGLFVRDQGAVGIDLKEHKLGFALLLKSDGNGLYLTKDLELIRRKFEDPSVTRSIVVVDARQKLHFRQAFKIAELMGYPQAKRSSHLSYETVNTADGKKAFSSRSKNGLKLGSLREQMEEQVRTEYLERYRGDWSDAEIDQTAEVVTIGALKYGMLKVDNNTPVNFDLKEWLRLDGDTGPYLQYVHARCLNILAKQGQPEDTTHSFILTERSEQELLTHLTKHFDAVRIAAEQLRPSIMSASLYDLAKAFNRFYEHCSIKDSTGPSRNSRLTLVAATGQVMAHGLGLLGISAPRKM